MHAVKSAGPIATGPGEYFSLHPAIALKISAMIMLTLHIYSASLNLL